MTLKKFTSDFWALYILLGVLLIAFVYRILPEAV